MAAVDQRSVSVRHSVSRAHQQSSDVTECSLSEKRESGKATVGIATVCLCTRDCGEGAATCAEIVFRGN